MKKIIILTLWFLPLLSQANLDQNTAAFNLSPLTFSWSYEVPITKNINLLNKAALEGSFSNVSNFHWAFSPKISCEARYYYNLKDKKENKGEVTNPASEYLALGLNHLFDQEVISNFDGDLTDNYFSLETKWGLRQTFKSNFFFEGNLGLGLYFIDWNPQIGPAGTLKIGWKL